MYTLLGMWFNNNNNKNNNNVTTIIIIIIKMGVTRRCLVNY